MATFSRCALVGGPCFTAETKMNPLFRDLHVALAKKSIPKKPVAKKPVAKKPVAKKTIPKNPIVSKSIIPTPTTPAPTIARLVSFNNTSGSTFNIYNSITNNILAAQFENYNITSNQPVQKFHLVSKSNSIDIDLINTNLNVTVKSSDFTGVLQIDITTSSNSYRGSFPISPLFSSDEQHVFSNLDNTSIVNIVINRADKKETKYGKQIATIDQSNMNQNITVGDFA